MEPIRWEDQVAVYTSEQVAIFGEASIPWDQYMVIDGQPDYVTSYMYQSHSQLKSIHRYDRQARFKKTLYNLLGWSNLSQSVKLASMDNVLAILKTFIKDDTINSYEDARKILVHYGYKELIPSIPALLKMCGKPPCLIVDQKSQSEIILQVMEDFKMIERRFFREDGYKDQRVYFPNMKYLAIKLLIERGAVNVCIPLLRTKRKLVDIDLVYNKLLKK